MLWNECFIFYVCLDEKELLSNDVFLTKARIILQDHIFVIILQKRESFFASFKYFYFTKSMYESILVHNTFCLIMMKSKRFKSWINEFYRVLRLFKKMYEIKKVLYDINGKYIIFLASCRSFCYYPATFLMLEMIYLTLTFIHV